MTSHVGKCVSLECGELGIYQGTVSSVDAEQSSLTIKNAFCNGKPCCPNTVSLLSAQIKGLSFVNPLTDPDQVIRISPVTDHKRDQSPLVERAAKPARIVRANTVVDQKEDFQSERMERPKVRRSNSFSAETHSDIRNSPRRDNSDRRTGSQLKVNQRSSCFSMSVDKMRGEFDFEGSNAMFDKQKVFSEIENMTGGQTDRRLTPRGYEQKIKHDEMIIKPTNHNAQNPTNQSSAIRQIKLIDPERGDTDNSDTFYTDDGSMIPCISRDLRSRLFNTSYEFGYSSHRLSDTIARNVCDMIIQLIGGSGRLQSNNLHQSPHVLVLSASHQQGSYGLNLARHLANHNIQISLFMATCSQMTETLQQDIKLYKSTGHTYITSFNDLPMKTVDLIVNCLENEESITQFSKQSWYHYIVNWSNTSRAYVLSIDPVLESSSIESKWTIQLGLPLHGTGSYKGSVYLCDTGIPKQIFKQNGLKYRSPFTTKFCIPIHLNQ